MADNPGRLWTDAQGNVMQKRPHAITSTESESMPRRPVVGDPDYQGRLWTDTYGKPIVRNEPKPKKGDETTKMIGWALVIWLLAARKRR